MFKSNRDPLFQPFFVICSILFLANCKKGLNDASTNAEIGITAFSFNVNNNTLFLTENINGIIQNDTIAITLNNTINISSIIPTIAHTGNSLAPAIGVSQNFNNPISYIVTADDGSTKRYFINRYRRLDNNIKSFITNALVHFLPSVL